MVILRRTQKLQRQLPESLGAGETSDTALGDWYVNRIVVHRRPLLLLVSERSLLSILTPARDVRALPGRLAELVAGRLARLEVRARIIEAELRAMERVQVAKTCDRSVLGTMVDFAKAVPFYLNPAAPEEPGLRVAEAKLEEMPCRVSRRSDEVVFPDRKAWELLERQWSAA